MVIICVNEAKIRKKEYMTKESQRKVSTSFWSWRVNTIEEAKRGRGRREKQIFTIIHSSFI